MKAPPQERALAAPARVARASVERVIVSHGEPLRMWATPWLEDEGDGWVNWSGPATLLRGLDAALGWSLDRLLTPV